MKKCLWGIAALAFVAIGCSKPDEVQPGEQKKVVDKPSEAVTPMAPTSGVPNAPVNNPQSVEGAGMGGLGQTAKQRAMSAAAKAGSPAGAGAPEPDPSAQ